MTNKPSFLSKLFSNNIFLLVISFLIAFGVWLTINASEELETSSTVSEVNINFSLSDDANENNEKVFCKTDVVSVDVSGSRLTVERLTPDDIRVSAQLGTIIDHDIHSVNLSANKSNGTSGFDIVSISPNSVMVCVDNEDDSHFTLEKEFSYDMDTTKYYYNDTLKYSELTLVGPSSEVSKINRVVAHYENTERLTRTTSIKCSLAYYDENNNELNVESDLQFVQALITSDDGATKDKTYLSDLDSIDGTVNVYPIKTVNLTATVENGPDNALNFLKITPNTLNVAGSQENLDELDELNVGTIDFSEVSNSVIAKNFVAPTPSDCKIVSKSSDVTVTGDFSAYVTKKITVKISKTSIPDGYSLKNSTITFTVVGPRAQIHKLKDTDIEVAFDSEALADLATAESSEVSIPLVVTLNKNYQKTCWVYKNYSVIFVKNS